MTTRLPAACVTALIIPIGAVMAWLAIVAIGERLGAAPSAGLAPQNSAEAAGMALAADMLRFLRQGDDPHEVEAVRPEIISSAVRRATTLEAAMWSRQLELVKLLDREGAIDARERGSLACLAVDLRLEEVAEYLAPQGTGHCVPDQALERVIARSR